MANTTSSAYAFDQNFSIDEIIADAYERLGLVGTAGHQIKTARRSLNILVFILFIEILQMFLEEENHLKLQQFQQQTFMVFQIF
jgi:hypothetical protein